MRKTLIFVIASSAFFAAMHNGVRFLSESLHPFEIAFFRSLFGLMILTPLLIKNGSKTFKTKKPLHHTLRGIFNGISILCWFTALSLMPVADATSISLVSPIFAIIGAMIFLGEKINTNQLIGIIIVLIGGIVIVQASFSFIGLGPILVFVSAICLAISKVIAKNLSNYDHPDTIVAYLTITMMIATFIPSLYFWDWPTINEIVYLVLIGGLGTLGHICLARAYTYSDLSIIDPLMFLRMIWASFFGYIIFDEFPNIFTWVGALVIVVGIIVITEKSSLLRKIDKIKKHKTTSH
tara:strand:- start:1469 stop:2350 length:882 start_codon:yes stop_codon:yes gene_type:complete